MPFARTPEAILERWLRILRLYGEAGAVLQALGVGEDRLLEPIEGEIPHEHAESASMTDTVNEVASQALEIARGRESDLVTTADLLLAVMRVHDADFDRVLQAHGVEREELMQRLDASLASC